MKTAILVVLPYGWPHFRKANPSASGQRGATGPGSTWPSHIWQVARVASRPISRDRGSRYWTGCFARWQTNWRCPKSWRATPSYHPAIERWDPGMFHETNHPALGGTPMTVEKYGGKAWTPHRCFVVDPDPGRSNEENPHLSRPSRKGFLLIEGLAMKLATKCGAWPFQNVGSSGKFKKNGPWWPRRPEMSALCGPNLRLQKVLISKHILFSGALNGFRTNKSDTRQNRNNGTSAFKHPVYTQYMFKNKESEQLVLATEMSMTSQHQTPQSHLARSGPED